jgi:AAHS family 4-hydroxybenzoate transporter-like MFS transporter
MDTNLGLGPDNTVSALNRQSGSPFDIGAALDAGTWGAFQKLVLVYVALAFAVDGLANQTLGLSIPDLMKDWGLGRHAFAPVIGISLIGVAIGATLGGVLGDKFGRRAGLLGSILLFGVLTLVTSRVDSIGHLTGLRFLAGLELGSTIPNATSLLAEFTPARRRTVAIGLALIFIPLGSLFSGLLASAILPELGWRMFFAIGGVVPLILLAGLFFLLPESPRYLVRRPARQAELRRLLARLGCHPPNDGTLMDAKQGGAKTSIKALFGKSTLFDTLALWGAFFACLMALYTFFSWGPVMLTGQGYGMAAVGAGLAAFNFGGIAGAVGSTWLTYRFGSRRTIIGMCVIAIAGSLYLGFFPVKASGSLWPLLIAFFIESFGIGGFQNVLYPLAAHIYPPFTKATGVGAASSAGRLGAVASAFAGLVAMQWRGASGYFLFLAAVMTVGLICALVIRNSLQPRANEIIGA